MLYYKCPSCRTILANKQIPYEKGLDKICENNKLSDEEKNDEKRILLDKLQLVNICCRMRMISYIKKVEILI